MAPAAISHGLGAYVWDIDGNRFLDCPMGLTSVSLGHAYEPVLDNVIEVIRTGANFQRPSFLEMEMAEKFLSLVPQHDMIKFAKYGSSVTTASINMRVQIQADFFSFLDQNCGLIKFSKR